MKKSAFTLVELSIVLVIIGLLVGGSFKVLKIMRDRAQTSRAQDDVQVAKEAVIGNTVQNSNTLPSVTFFNQNLSPIKNNQHQLFYADDTNLENIDVCSFNTTNLKVVTAARTIDNVAFVIASESSNHNMQTAIKDNGDGTFSVKTYDYSTKVDDNTSPVNIIDYYDDIVDWVTLSQLQQEAKCSNNLLRIVNSSLPDTDTLNSASYQAKIVIDGNYSAPTADNCTFSPTNNFSYNNFSITNSGGATAGTVTVDCSVSADGKTVRKKFAITVNQASGTGGGSGGGGFGGFGGFGG
ncbi:type II secretion system protein [Sulfurimonas autotrophica]|uniref:Prepilin-type N-terminal cleavage/methylation domain-containing protein n=1 Tax=Sulfurimonas autotrophica (strain ATCC BAA-671 / DSM 16294 / JCM 11897 / OK10) TaxID=563040 RepID=E0UP39_SULAO|nr:prepilin-type N-terminal cleavage/methylation domain-containing protein [Sulfurimonas autotrophica]ADN08072.1 hypothetical protein Saut_0023 [Sulfurimonas autotrophica DSM 16294]